MTRKRVWYGLATAVVVGAAGGGMVWTIAQPEEVRVDPALPAYENPSPVSGTVRVGGATTAMTVVGSWVDAFERVQSGVRFEMKGGGSAQALKQLASGEIDVAVTSVTPPREHMQALTQALGGNEPERVAVGVEAVAVFVHRDNPVRSLTLEQLASIYTARARTWGDVGVGGEWASKPIRAYGLPEQSGPHEIFRHVVLRGGRFGPGVDEQRTSSTAVTAAGVYDTAIAYAGQSYETGRVRPVPISREPGGEAALPVQGELARYPLARELWAYLRVPRGQRPGAAVAEFLQFALSKDGQTQAVKQGAFPLESSRARRELAKLGG